MKSKKQFFSVLIAAIGMVVLIIDSKTAMTAAANGIDMCIRTVIPSLFPFFVVSNMLIGALTGTAVSFIRPFTRCLGVPEGGESILLIGLLGGYPVGAQCIASLHKNKQINASDARRLLGFCSNAGPAFIFGIVSRNFTNAEYIWAIWLIHMISSFLVGAFLPGKRDYRINHVSQKTAGFTDVLKGAITTTAIVCGWVVIFRIIIAFLERWFLWLLPDMVQHLLVGMLELVNACAKLPSIECEGLRLCLCSCFLALGGACVAMQTVSVTERVGTGLYFPGKILQAGFSFALTYLYQAVRFTSTNRFYLPHFALLIILFAAVLFSFKVFRSKKTVAFQRDIVYNR